MANVMLCSDHLRFTSNGSDNNMHMAVTDGCALFSATSGNPFKIRGLSSNPTNDDEAATKGYVDAVKEGLDLKESVRAATTAAGTLASSFANGQVIDGVTLATGDRILIKDQATGSENGIYTVNPTGAPTRTDDFLGGHTVAGAYTFVEEGTTLADHGFVATNNAGNDTVDTHSIVFTKFSHQAILAGTNLERSGNTISFPGTIAGNATVGGTITANSTLVLGSGSITDTLGTIDFDNERLITSGILQSGNHTVSGTSTISETLTVDGAATFNDSLAVQGSTHLEDTLTVDGVATFNGQTVLTATLSSNSAGTFGNTLTASGASITDSPGTISFGATNLTTSGTLVAGNQQVTGALMAGGAIYAECFHTLSDQRLKTDVELYPDAMGDLHKLRGVTYKWLGNGKEDAGVLAQDVYAVLPSACGYDPDGFLRVDYGRLAPLFIESIKDLQAQVDALKLKA